MLKDDKAQMQTVMGMMMLLSTIVVVSVVMPVIVDTIEDVSVGPSDISGLSPLSSSVLSVATPVVTFTPVQNVGEPVKTTNLNIHAEKTNVAVGEDILIKLSAVNLITKKTMHIQVILVPPSGMGVSTSTFVFSGAGQYTSDFRIEPGQGRDIEIALVPNQAGDFNIEGRAVYYFGDDIINSEDYKISVPVHVAPSGAIMSVATVKTQDDEQISNQNNMGDEYATLVSIIPILIMIAFLMLLLRPVL